MRDLVPLRHLTGAARPPDSDAASSIEEQLIEIPGDDHGEHRTNSPNASSKIPITRPWMPLSALELTLHAASVAFTAAVLYLCAGHVYFSDISRRNINSVLNVFQVVAATHAIIVNLSLGAMAVCHLQYELCVAEGLPPTYLVLPFQLSSLRPLFTPPFWRAAWNQTSTKRTRLFAGGVALAVLIQTLVGPTSAILIVPQLRWWSIDTPFDGVNGFFYLNSSHDHIWPTNVPGSIVPSYCGIDDFDIPQQCPYAGVTGVAKWASEHLTSFADPNITMTTNANMVRYLEGIVFNGEGYSAVSTGMGHIVRDLGNAWVYVSRRNRRIRISRSARPKLTLTPLNWSQPVMRPLVQAQCNMPIDISDREQDMYDVAFNTSELRFPPGQTVSGGFTTTVNVSSLQAGSPKASFVDLTKEAGVPTLGALVGMQFYNAKDMSFANDEAQGLLACVLATHWIPTNMSIDPKTDNVVIMDPAPPLQIVNSTELMARSRSINVTISYANAINPGIGGGRGKVLEYGLQPAAVVNDGVGQPYRYDGTWKRRWAYVVATTVSMQMCDALARIKGLMTMMTYCERCADQAKDPGMSIVQDLAQLNDGRAGAPLVSKSHDEFVSDILSRPDLYTPVGWKVERYGYGWALKDVGEILAATLVLIHVALVFVHIGLAMLRRWQCTRWEELSDLLVLANRSPASDILQGAAARSSDKDIGLHRIVIREGEEPGTAVLTTQDSALRKKKLEAGVEYS